MWRGGGGELCPKDSVVTGTSSSFPPSTTHSFINRKGLLDYKREGLMTKQHIICELGLGETQSNSLLMYGLRLTWKIVHGGGLSPHGAVAWVSSLFPPSSLCAFANKKGVSSSFLPFHHVHFFRQKMVMEDRLFIPLPDPCVFWTDT